MKKILLLLLVLLASCSLNKVVQHHGVHNLEKKQAKLKINYTNKNDIIKLIGPPSSKSDFNEVWFYIERKKTNQSIIKLGKKKIEENNIIIIEFSDTGIVKNKRLLSLDDMNELKIAEKKTEKKFREENLLYDIMTTLREKINAPTRR